MKTPYKNTPLIGAGFSAINAAMLASAGVFTKYLTETFDPVEIIFFRNLIGLPMLVLGYMVLRQHLTLKTNRPWHQIIRATIGTIAVVTGVWAISLLNLAEVTALFFTSPLFVIILSAIFLKEKIGIFRIIAVLIGFSGVLIIANPSGDIPAIGLIAGLGFAFGAALVDICLRWLGNTEKSSTTTFYFMVLGLCALSFYLPFAENIQNIKFSWWLIVLLIGLGLTNVFALLAKSESFRHAEASIIAPVTYTMIIWSILFDYLIWNHTPNPATLIGATIIITSNLVILYREHKKL